MKKGGEEFGEKIVLLFLPLKKGEKGKRGGTRPFLYGRKKEIAQKKKKEVFLSSKRKGGKGKGEKNPSL